MIRLLYLLVATLILIVYFKQISNNPIKIEIAPPTRQTTDPAEANIFMRACGFNATISRKDNVFFVTCREK